MIDCSELFEISGTPRRKVPVMDLLESTLRSHGHRHTRARRIVWDVLLSSDQHLSASEIIRRVHAQEPQINASSTYRALDLLAELGLVRESRLNDEASTWEPRHADSVIHLLCSKCGIVTHHHTALIDDLADRLSDAVQFTAASIDVRVDGLCSNCRHVDQ